MRIVYPYPEPMDSGKARHIQAWKTACALARQHELTLAVADGCDFSGAPAGLKLVSWPRHLNFGLFRVSLQKRFMQRCVEHLRSVPDDAIVLLRHLRLADHLLHAGIRQKVVFEVHEFFSDNPELSRPRARELEKMEGRVLLKSAGLVCITRGLVDALQQRYLKLPPVEVAADGCDPAPSRNGGDRFDADLIYAGSLQPWKGVETLVQAMAYLPGRTLKVVGGGGDALGRLRREAARWKVEDQCEFTGQLPHDRVAGHIRTARAGVLPNRHHTIGTSFTSPLKLFEYLSAGLPVVASDLPSLREVLTDQTAVFFPPDSPRSLAVAAKRILGDEERRRTMAEAARTQAGQYSWDARAEKISAFLGRL